MDGDSDPGLVSRGSVLVALSTYNEIENLPGLIDAIQRHLPVADILVVDDNSPDGTGDWVRRLAAQDARLHGIHREGKLGLGSATVAAMRHAIDQRYDWLLTMDADFSHDPNYLPQLLQTAVTSEPDIAVVIGSRYVSGGGIRGWPWSRRLMSRAMNGLTRLLLRLSPRDCTGAFRCYRVATLRKLDWDTVQATGYAFFEEILWRLSQRGERFREVPIVFADRERGQTKLGWREACTAVGCLITLRWHG